MAARPAVVHGGVVGRSRIPHRPAPVPAQGYAPSVPDDTSHDRLPVPAVDAATEVAERLGPDAAIVGRPQQVSQELDIDGDGEVDAVSQITRAAIDTSGDGRADTFLEARTTVLDLDGDNVADVVSRTETVLVDIDGDGTPDIIRRRRVISQDTTGDGEPDVLTVEEAEGFLDDQGNFVPLDDDLDLEAEAEGQQAGRAEPGA
jgi:hypothetical protein